MSTAELRKKFGEENIKPSESYRIGTFTLFQNTSKKSTSPVPRIVNAMFCLMSFNSSFQQLIVAMKWLPTLPGASLVLLFKELFGLAIILKPAIASLINKPEGNVFDSLLDPFQPAGLLCGVKLPSSIQPMIRALFFTFGALSNSRAALSLAVAARWDVALPLMAQETELQKIANLMVLSIDLAIKTKDESKPVNIYLFSGLIWAILMICLSHYNHSTAMFEILDWLNDVNEGKLTKGEILLGIEGIAKMTTGQEPGDKLAENIVNARPDTTSVSIGNEETEIKAEEHKKDE